MGGYQHAVFREEDQKHKPAVTPPVTFEPTRLEPGRHVYLFRYSLEEIPEVDRDLIRSRLVALNEELDKRGINVALLELPVAVALEAG